VYEQISSFAHVSIAVNAFAIDYVCVYAMNRIKRQALNARFPKMIRWPPSHSPSVAQVTDNISRVVSEYSFVKILSGNSRSFMAL
jgi:hypothetical protein